MGPRPILRNLTAPPLVILILLSGFSGLSYEVLWLKAFKILTGSTVLAVSCVLSAFFAGLAGGGYFWGRKLSLSKNPLKDYALLETGIGISACLYFSLFPVFYRIYQPVFVFWENAGMLFVFAKFVLAASVVLIPAFFMGGTLPALSAYVVTRPVDLGEKTAALYAINTAGAALGAFLTGFYLPVILGFRGTYLLTVGISLSVGVLAWLLSLWTPAPSSDVALPPYRENRRSGHPPSPLFFRTAAIVALFSGFITLGLEVLWTHMFSQVLLNSVYTFSAILVVILIALALGSFLASLLSRADARPPVILSLLLSLSGLLVLITPFIFNRISGSLDYHSPPPQGWGTYIPFVFRQIGLTLGVPCLIIGIVFPYLLKVEELAASATGQSACHRPAAGITGRLLALNTIGAILGSLFAGFILIKAVGIWNSVRLMGVLYFLLAAWTAVLLRRSKWLLIFPLLGLLSGASILNSSHLPLITLDLPMEEKLVELWEGNYGTVAVIRKGYHLQLRMNNFFTLGAVHVQFGRVTPNRWIRLGDLPLILHPEAQSVFFIGMGTGITAAASLDHPSVQKITVCELVPEVIEAAKKYFSRYYGLFTSPKARVIPEDGRNYLLGSPAKYDVIIGDLFFPWEAGAGSLYTREHFQTIARRLNPGGLFAQWLPVYQMSEREFSIIAKTMTEVFPQVTLWRGDFHPRRPLMALVAQNDPLPVDPNILFRNFLAIDSPSIIPHLMKKTLSFTHYAGNLTAGKKLLAPYPVNTDDRPMIEYLAPLTYLDASTNKASWFVGHPLARFSEQLLEFTPPETDPFLKKLALPEINAVRAGLFFYQAQIAAAKGGAAGAEKKFRTVCQLVGDPMCGFMRANWPKEP